jgi:carboxyl-terminal processing protease
MMNTGFANMIENGHRILRSCRLGLMPWVGWAFVFSGCVSAPREPVLTQGQRNLNVESFDYVWTTVRDKHFDPTLGGLDWEAVRQELRPKVQQACTMSQARDAMMDMLLRLNQSHFDIIPGEYYEAESESAGDAGARRYGVTGVDLRVIDHHVLVTAVTPGSPADEAGVQPGWEITRVGREKVSSLIRDAERKCEAKTWAPAEMAYAVGRRLNGPLGGEVQVTFLDGDDRKRVLDLHRVEPRGKEAYRIGEIAPHRVWFDSRRMGQDVGYITFNEFTDPAYLMRAFNDAVESFLDADGIVIDLRGNGGGLGAMPIWMAGWFIKEEGSYLCKEFTRDREFKAIITPRAKTYDGKLAILVDGLTASSAEMFAGGLRDLGRARVFGSRTAGASLPATIDKLPNGDRFKYAVARDELPGGQPIEGIGVTPDVLIEPTRQDLLAGRDPALEAAVAWIRNLEPANAEDTRK